MTQGQSWATDHKERGLRALFKVNLQICKGISERRGFSQPYWHFDLHAGSGWNDKFDVMGSPLAFYSALEEIGHPRAITHFVEKNEGRAFQLEDRLREELRDSPWLDWQVHWKDNAEFIPRIPYIIREQRGDPEWAMGTILLDPNGPTDTPYDKISDVMSQLPRLDVIYNFCGTGNKRLPNGHGRKILIDDIPRLFHKKHWLVRKQIGAYQWSVLIGRNHPVNDYAKEGFHHWDSDEGQKVIRTLRTTRSEQRATISQPQVMKQMELFV